MRASVVALASYPRSGNSLLRLLLERLTGVWTGSIYNVRNRTVFMQSNLERDPDPANLDAEAVPEALSAD